MKSGMVAARDTGNALIQGVGKGDWRAMQNVADNQLQGKYGSVVQGYAMAGHTLTAAVTGDSKALNKFTDDAASGKLGVLAKTGDWIGDKVAEGVITVKSWFW
jgi:hypothetical protein